MLSKNRIIWVDIFKALTIISVVIGHATGTYNMFIYQFHMAAFFFISGYTTNFKKRAFWANVWHKFCTILLPLFTVFCGSLLLLNVFQKFWPGMNMNDPFPFSLTNKFIWHQFFLGRTYISWLGATWFLLALFGACILQNFIWLVTKGKAVILSALSLTLFLIGYALIWEKINVSYVDLILIAQIFFLSGMLFKKHNVFEGKLFSNKYGKILFLLSAIVLCVFAFVYHGRVNWPTRDFNSPIFDYVMSINGIIFMYYCASIVGKSSQKIANVFCLIGENTLAILFFHFLLFKLVFCILGIQVDLFLPPNDMGNKYLLLFILVPVFGSIGIWIMLSKIPFLKAFIGEDKELYDIIFGKASVNLQSYFILIISKFTAIYNKIKKEINLVPCIFVSSIIIVVTSNYFLQGITLNDEIQARFFRMGGLLSAIKYWAKAEIRQGRPLRVMSAINSNMGFISNYYIISRCFQIALLLINISLFGYLIFKLMKNKSLAVMTAVFSLVFIPITFECAMPNAFVCLTEIPIFFLFLSLLTFEKFLAEKNCKWYAVSMLFWILALLGYEFMVTYVLMFPILIWVKNHKTMNTKQMLKQLFGPFVLAFLYVALLLMMQKFYKVTYPGAKISLVSFASSFHVSWTLVKSSMPGYYLFNNKYIYLYNFYADNATPFWGINSLKDLFKTCNLIQLVGALKWGVKEILNVKCCIIFGVMYYICRNGWKSKFDHETINNNKFYIPAPIFVVLFVYLFIPTLPNSITEMYQKTVSSSVFTGLPVSSSLYFISSFLVSGILWNIAQRLKNNKAFYLIICFVCVYCCAIQQMNAVIAREQHRNYQRFLTMERLFNTQVMKSYNDSRIYAPTLFKTNNGLVTSGYWNMFANHAGLKIDLFEILDKKADYNVRIFEKDDIFFFIDKEKGYALSLKPINDSIFIPLSEFSHIKFQLKNAVKDGSFYRYSFEFKKIQNSYMLYELPARYLID